MSLTVQYNDGSRTTERVRIGILEQGGNKPLKIELTAFFASIVTINGDLMKWSFLARRCSAGMPTLHQVPAHTGLWRIDAMFHRLSDVVLEVRIAVSRRLFVWHEQQRRAHLDCFMRLHGLRSKEKVRRMEEDRGLR